MLKLKLQYFGHLMQELTHWKRSWCWARLTTGGEWRDRMRLLNGTMTQWSKLSPSEQTPGDSEGQGSLVCCSPWGHKESDTTEEPEIKLPTTTGSLKEREFQKDIYFSFIDYAKAFDHVDHNKVQKILQKMGIPDSLTCLLKNLYTSQEATVRTRHGTVDWFQIEKEVHQGCIVAVRLVQKEKEWVGQSGKKRKFIRGKRAGDWLLRRTSILHFWQSPSYTPSMKILWRNGHIAGDLESGAVEALRS